MKKNLILATGLALALFSCQSKTYKVDGTIPAEQNLDGKFVTLKVANDENPEGLVIDSAKIEAGKFHFEGEVTDSIEDVLLSVETMMAPVILEAGDIVVDLKESVATGTPLNDEATSFSKELKAVIESVKGQIQSLNDQATALGENPDKEAMAKLRTEYHKLIDSVNKVSVEIAGKVFDKHTNDVVGVMALKELISSDSTEEEIQGLLDRLGEKAKKHRNVQAIMKELKLKKETLAGQPYKDFEGVNDNNEAVKLSDYVGKGKYVLVDFWASWCRPCREELQNLKEIRKQYSEDKLTIVGVAVWDSMEKHLEAVKDEAITWAQIFNKQEATKLYSIKGIPQIMLISPEGVIVARDLRGEDIKKLLEEKLK